MMSTRLPLPAIDSRGSVDYSYRISCPSDWLSFSETEGKSCLTEHPRITIAIHCDRSRLVGEACTRVHLDFFFENGARTWSEVEIKAGSHPSAQAGPAFVETEGYVCINAANYAKTEDVQGMGWRIVPRLGRMCDAIKAFPVEKNWEAEAARPYAEYRFVVRRAGTYTVQFYLSPRNPLIKGGSLKGAYGVNRQQAVLFDTVPQGYYAEWQDDVWSYGVTNNIRKISQTIELNHGLNTLQFYAVDPNLILEHIVIFHVDTPIRDTHLAPPESYQIIGAV